MTTSHHDLVIIGGGPGGYVAAIRAAQLGLKTALVERAELGGICLNWGCIPTKALLQSAAVLRQCREAASYGIGGAADPQPDLAAIVDRSRQVAGKLRGGVAHLMKKNGVTVYRASARLQAPGQVALDDGKLLQARDIIIATGARARELPALPVGPRIWTYRQALQPASLPGRLLVVGAGAIGVEFASFYLALGSAVTLVDTATQILPQEDAEIAALARKAFERQGMTVRTGCGVLASRPAPDSVSVTLEQDGKREDAIFDAVIVAAGIVGNVEGLGLEKTRVQIKGSHIETDARCRTAEPGIHAIGDVAGAPWLAHKASHEGSLCVEAIAGKDTHELDPRHVPACTYSHPQVASIGLTEARAREWAAREGRTLNIGRFPFSANGKAIAMGEEQGLVKTLFDSNTGELLGAHIVHPEASELIASYAVATALEATDADLAQTIFAHPTLSEALHEATLAGLGRALHI